MATLAVPTLSVLLGQGTGGAALALLPTDRAVAAVHSWLTPLPPEGASVILHDTQDRAPEAPRYADALAAQCGIWINAGTRDEWCHGHLRESTPAAVWPGNRS